MAAPPDYDRQVFINCPFDEAYQPFFQALVFTAYEAGVTPRCGLEVSDTSEVRLDKIMRLIGACRLGIHDVSRTEPDAVTGLPRFNMPLELGLFLGCKRFGAGHHRKKSCLVLDRDRYRYQRFISDIAGQDPESHGGDPEKLIRCVRNWLRSELRAADMAGSDLFVNRFRTFQRELPKICGQFHLDATQLTYPDLTHVVSYWIAENRPA